MGDNNQAYLKRCGECQRSVDKLTITQVSADGTSRRLYRLLCADCRKRYE